MDTRGHPEGTAAEDDGDLLIPLRPAMVWLWRTRHEDRMRPCSLSKRDFRAFWHLGRSYFYRLIGRGLPVLPDGRVPFYEGGEWLEANIGPTMRHPNRPSIEDEDVRDPFAIDYDAEALEALSAEIGEGTEGNGEAEAEETAAH